MNKNEDGITLVELLASLALVSMVVTLIWTTFFISARHNTAETTKLRLQQEANYILTTIQQQHRQKDCYRLIVADDELKFRDCVTEDEELISKGFTYDLNIGKTTTIEPKAEDLHLVLIVKYPNEKSKLQVQVDTTISRFKTQ